MSWISFLSYLGTAYLLYYLVVFMLDARASPHALLQDKAPVLTFPEDVVPEKLSMEDFMVAGAAGSQGAAGSAVKGTGGVSLKELFNLARNDAIAYTRAVSF